MGTPSEDEHNMRNITISLRFAVPSSVLHSNSGTIPAIADEGSDVIPLLISSPL
jgi:hypothetical protein